MTLNYIAAYRRAIAQRKVAARRTALAGGAAALETQALGAAARFWATSWRRMRIGLSYIFPGRAGDGVAIAHRPSQRRDPPGPGPMWRAFDHRPGNWITGHPPQGAHFRQREGRDPSFILGAHAAVTKSHIIDCTDRWEIGPLHPHRGGYHCTITHGIDLDSSRQDCRPIRIGAYLPGGHPRDGDRRRAVARPLGAGRRLAAQQGAHRGMHAVRRPAGAAP